MLRIYGVPVSVHTRKAIVAALAKDLPHEVVPVVPVIPGNPPPNWRELSPTGKIPALQDGGFTLFDSAAICAYFERLRPAPALYPEDPRQFATALALEQYGGTLFREVVQPLFLETIVNPKIRNMPTDAKRVEQVLSQALPGIFGYLEGLANDTGFFVGGQFSIADITIASNLTTYQYLGFGLDRALFPGLASHYDRAVRQPCMREALRREAGVVGNMGLHADFLAAVLG
jgi:glutathione S-transferase